MHRRYGITLWSALLVLALAATSCGSATRNGSSRTTAEESMISEPARRFIPALPPSTLQGEAYTEYMAKHYWDRFDFADTTFIAEVEPQHMTTAFAVYVSEYVTDATANHLMSNLMARAATSRQMFDYFLRMAEVVLHDPNSPLRNDEKYIPVLEATVASPLYDEVERLPYEYDLEMARQNRVGREANDFTLTLDSGRSMRMYDIEADYLLIFISNAGCPMCREVKEQIVASPLMNELTERGTLKVVVLYPDKDLAAWREQTKEYPEAWICAYDNGQIIERERLYDLKAIPALYLLDRDKRVMAKDCTDVAYIEELITRAEEQ